VWINKKPPTINVGKVKGNFHLRKRQQGQLENTLIEGVGGKSGAKLIGSLLFTEARASNGKGKKGQGVPGSPNTEGEVKKEIDSSKPVRVRKEAGLQGRLYPLTKSDEQEKSEEHRTPNSTGYWGKKRTSS